MFVPILNCRSNNVNYICVIFSILCMYFINVYRHKTLNLDFSNYSIFFSETIAIEQQYIFST